MWRRLYFLPYFVSPCSFQPLCGNVSCGDKIEMLTKIFASHSKTKPAFHPPKMSDQNACLSLPRDTFRPKDTVFYAECAPEPDASGNFPYVCQGGQTNPCIVMSNPSGQPCQMDLCCPSGSAKNMKRKSGGRVADYQCPAGYEAYPNAMSVDFTRSCDSSSMRPGVGDC
jgi:hypothetical protein